MKSVLMRGLFIFQIVFVVTLNLFMVGCGGDEAEDDVDTLYEELVGTYELFRAELTFPDGNEVVLEPPDIAGSMTISSDRKITQNIKVYSNTIVAKGTFELFPDENVIEINNEIVDFTSRATYTWDGNVLTTTIDLGTVIETDFWRKL